MTHELEDDTSNRVVVVQGRVVSGGLSERVAHVQVALAVVDASRAAHRAQNGLRPSLYGVDEALHACPRARGRMHTPRWVSSARGKWLDRQCAWCLSRVRGYLLLSIRLKKLCASLSKSATCSAEKGAVIGNLNARGQSTCQRGLSTLSMGRVAAALCSKIRRA